MADCLNDMLEAGALNPEQRSTVLAKLKKLQTGHEQERITSAVANTDKLGTIPIAEIDPGVNKYVMLVATVGSSTDKRHYVRSKNYAKYHYMAAEPLKDQLIEECGLDEDNIEIVGEVVKHIV